MNLGDAMRDSDRNLRAATIAAWIMAALAVAGIIVILFGVRAVHAQAVQPPPWFRGPPTMRIIEYVQAPEYVNRVCHSWQPLWSKAAAITGCAKALFSWNLCVIVRVADLSVSSHERGHCNGWTHAPRPVPMPWEFPL